VIDLLRNAGVKGLEPEDYDSTRWQGRLLKLSQSPSERDLVSFDTALTVSAMRYIRAVHCGRVNPKEFKFELDVEGSPLPLAEFTQTHVLNASDPAGEIQKLEPPFLGYKKLLALLPVYEKYAKKDDGEKSDHYIPEALEELDHYYIYEIIAPVTCGTSTLVFSTFCTT